MKRLAWLIALVPFSPFACSGGGNTSDAGADAAHDGTTADVHDSSPDTALDAPKDVAKDTASDVTTSDASDAGTGDASDGGSGDASDASSSDASADATGDAADGGSSWHTPTCDGTISSGEYGDSNYQTTSGTQTWYMTWDATNLYVAVAVADVTQGTVLYVGFSGSGLTSGQLYDSTNGSLPFPADAVVYAHSGYNEIRLGSVDAGTWVPSNTTIQFCDDGNTTREEVIPWTALGASAIPASFRFLAYATSSGGFVYGQIPTSNPSGQIGTSATFAHDFFVSGTANGSGAFPFATTE